MISRNALVYQITQIYRQKSSLLVWNALLILDGRRCLILRIPTLWQNLTHLEVSVISISTWQWLQGLSKNFYLWPICISMCMVLHTLKINLVSHPVLMKKLGNYLLKFTGTGVQFWLKVNCSLHFRDSWISTLWQQFPHFTKRDSVNVGSMQAWWWAWRMGSFCLWHRYIYMCTGSQHKNWSCVTSCLNGIYNRFKHKTCFFLDIFYFVVGVNRRHFIKYNNMFSSFLELW